MCSQEPFPCCSVFTGFYLHRRTAGALDDSGSERNWQRDTWGRESVNLLDSRTSRQLSKAEHEEKQSSDSQRRRSHYPNDDLNWNCQYTSPNDLSWNCQYISPNDLSWHCQYILCIILWVFCHLHRIMGQLQLKHTWPESLYGGNSLVCPTAFCINTGRAGNLGEPLLPSLTHQLPAEFRVPLILFTLEAVVLPLSQIRRTGSKSCFASLREIILPFYCQKY